MKHLFQSATLLLLIVGFLFYACKKDNLITSPTINTNKPPVAVAGPDQTITLPTNAVTLDGSASKDTDNNIINYAWRKISGPSLFNIANAGSVQSQVTNLAEGVYQFELTVTDSLGLFDKDSTTVSVNKIYANEKIFSDQKWGFNYIRLIFIPDLYTHLPVGISFKVFIKRDNTNTWKEVVYIPQQWTFSPEYVFDLDNGNLWIYTNLDDENDTPDIKIVY